MRNTAKDFFRGVCLPFPLSGEDHWRWGAWLCSHREEGTGLFPERLSIGNTYRWTCSCCRHILFNLWREYSQDWKELRLDISFSQQEPENLKLSFLFLKYQRKKTTTVSLGRFFFYWMLEVLSRFLIEDMQGTQLHSVVCSSYFADSSRCHHVIQHSSWFQALLYGQEHWKLAFMFEVKTDILVWLYEPNNLECGFQAGLWTHSISDWRV